MSLDKDKSPQERVNRRQVRDSAAKAEADRKALADELRQKNAARPDYDSAGNPLSEVEKVNKRKSEERADSSWQTSPDFDRDKGGWQEKAGDALRIGGKAYPFIRDALKILGGFNLQRAKADTTDIVDELMINPELPDQLLASNAGDDILNSLPRGGYYRNSHRDALKSGELTEDKLIESLKLAAPHLLEKADLPLHIRGPRMPGTVKGTPHIDSPFMDRYLQDYRKKENQNKGPQLPWFV
tara:strand:+ start:36 stop:758 length:723 start_codon:yes stop_codon:yes gene_type:complete